LIWPPSRCPSRAERVLEVGHEHLRAGVQRVDDHLALDRAGDLDAAVLQRRPGSAPTRQSPSRMARVSGRKSGSSPASMRAWRARAPLPNLVQAFRERHPKVRLHLVNVTGAEGLAMLRSDTADFAVGSMIDVPGDLAYEAVYHFDPMLITPPNHPLMQKADIRLEDLSPYGLILPPRRMTTYRLVDLIFQQARVPYQVAIEVGGWEIIKQYVSMGLGISIVTGLCLRPGDRLEVRNMRAWFPQRSYGVVMRKGKYLSPQARAFIDLIKPGMFSRRDWFESGHSER
jgi:DNA-binding transcriptional LysR family regulator